MRSAMQPHRFRSFWPRRRLAWLLWLGLLLPLAQVAAASHALTHLRGALGGEIDNKGVAQASHCDLCVAAAAIAGGGAISEAPALTPPLVCHDAPRIASAGVWLALPLRAYLSRAPPLASL
jgi:hypothetical protein